jgi:hypothetical protein
VLPVSFVTEFHRALLDDRQQTVRLSIQELETEVLPLKSVATKYSKSQIKPDKEMAEVFLSS